MHFIISKSKAKWERERVIKNVRRDDSREWKTEIDTRVYESRDTQMLSKNVLFVDATWNDRFIKEKNDYYINNSLMHRKREHFNQNRGQTKNTEGAKTIIASVCVCWRSLTIIAEESDSKVNIEQERQSTIARAHTYALLIHCESNMRCSNANHGNALRSEIEHKHHVSSSIIGNKCLPPSTTEFN